MEIKKDTLGQTWKELVKLTKNKGIQLADEGLEILDIKVNFKHSFNEKDLILEKYADKMMIENMQKVFFTNEKMIWGIVILIICVLHIRMIMSLILLEFWKKKEIQKELRLL